MPIAVVTALHSMAQLVGVNRIVQGVSIPHPCGDPHMPPEQDRLLRRNIVETALKALQSDVTGPTLFTPERVAGKATETF